MNHEIEERVQKMALEFLLDAFLHIDQKLDMYCTREPKINIQTEKVKNKQ